jgi:hypothetical protein
MGEVFLPSRSRKTTFVFAPFRSIAYGTPGEIAMKRISALLVFSLLAACSLPEPRTNSAASSEEPPPASVEPRKMESNAGCSPVLPEAIPEENRYATVVEEFEVVAPSGSRLYGLIRRPDPAGYPGLCFAAVVLVPGGINPGRTGAFDEDAKMLASAGMAVLTFNAEGRVDERMPEDKRSEGAEDYNGFRNQDGLCAVVEYAADLSYVISGNVGIASHSFGIAMAAGCAGRHPDAPVKYLVDGEGPPDSFVTCHEPSALDSDPSNNKVELIHGILGRYSISRDPSEENRAFWAEREAIRFIGKYRGRYLRLQATWDHAQPPQSEADIAAFTVPPVWWPNKHTTDIVNAAVSDGVPWVRVNLPEQGNAVNATFDMDHPPVYLPGTLKEKPWSVRAILEMARMP